MISYIWPIALVVLSNTVYHICAKNSPEGVNPFATLSITYLVGAVVSTIIYFVTSRQTNLIREITKMNWAPFILGIVIVGLEAGWIFAYKAGWQVSIGSIVQSSFLAIMLIIVGTLFFHEAVTWNKLVGIAVCMVGLVIINLK